MLMFAGVSTRPSSCRHALSVVRSVSAASVSNQQQQRQHLQRQQRSFSSSKEEDELKKKNAELAVSFFKNPIVNQLWTARVAAKERQTKKTTGAETTTTSATTSTTTTTIPAGKTPSESHVEITYPFTTDQLLLETYRNPWGKMRFGRMIEDLDALAGNIAFFHVDNPNDLEQEHPVIVTASVDRIRLRERPTMDSDQHLSGHVTWTGTSSMEISMQCTDNNGQEWLQAYVTFVTLDPVTKKPTAIPPVIPQTDQEHADFQAGAVRAAAKKKRRHSKKTVQLEMDDLADALLAEAGPLLNMPSLADPHSILTDATKMQNAMIAQPQVQNLHNRIFGGFLMRRAFELAFSTAYVFGGARPLFLEVDDVSFASPVDVGDLLVFNSRVLYTDTGRLKDYYTRINNSSDSSTDDGTTTTTTTTKITESYDPDQELPLVHIEVEAWVTEPEKASARLSNQFYFTFAISKAVDPGESDWQVRRVLPSNIDQARRMAMRMLVDQEQDREQ
jgi:acyl-coenzyme A thioesterase 9